MDRDDAGRANSPAMPISISPTLGRAEAAFRAGRLDKARRDLALLLDAAGDRPEVCHLAALVARRQGDVSQALDLFRRALVGAPRDPQIHNNYANLLAQTGDHASALHHYGRAIEGTGAAAIDALFNRAALLNRLDRHEDALVDLDATIRLAPANAAAHSLRGIVLRSLERLDEAADALDRALALQSSRPIALQGRARVALERGEAGAASLFRRCIAAGAGDRDVLLGLANALEAEGDPQGMALLANAVEQFPDWVEAHEELARMRSEAGQGNALTASFVAALAKQPGNSALHVAHWRTLSRADRHAEALMAVAEARAVLPDGPELSLEEVNLAIEARDWERADIVLRSIGHLPEALVPGARRALAGGEADRAAVLLDARIAEEPDDIAAWAYRDLAWRVLDDPRHQWLSGQPGLHATSDLDFAQSDLDDLAALLRSLHLARTHPIGQSLRQGTQTRGRLLQRTEPVLRHLRSRLLAAIRSHLEKLPPKDERHPLLRHRGETPQLAGSWSVRLTAQGFHVSHIHTRGLLSSAMYVSLPPDIGSGDRSGWLELGRPPEALGLGLPPLALVEPRPGRLALFPSYMFHGTRPFSAGERLSVAFDVTF